MIAPGGTLGRYRIEALLGRGAMGDVWRAVDPMIGRDVAIKAVRLDAPVFADSPEELLARFQQEARSAGRLKHPNVVAIYDYGEDDGLYYLVMEFVEGTTLAARLAAHGPLPPHEACAAVLQACAALGAAHRKGIVHRDVKPANLMIEAETGLLKVLDFGIARLEATHMTRTGTVFGTPSYMAPEQILGRWVDHRTDLFSLGAVFYEILTGQKAFPGDHLATIAYKIVNEEPKGLHELPARLGQGYAFVLARALGKEPAERFQTAEEFAEAVQTYALGSAAPPRVPRTAPPGSEPVAVPLPGGGPRRSRRVVTLAAALGVVLLAVGAGAWAYFGGGRSRSGAPMGGGLVAVGASSATAPPAGAERPPEPPVTTLGDSAAAPADSAAASAAAAASDTAPTPPVDGAFDVTANVPGRVLLDGRDIGRTPRRGFRIGAGTYTVTFVPDGAAGLAERRRLTVQPGGSQRVEFRVTDGFLTVAVRSPAWARVVLDGRPAGDTPLIDRRVSAGTHLVRLEREGYAGIERAVEVAPGQTARWVNVELGASP